PRCRRCWRSCVLGVRCRPGWSGPRRVAACCGGRRVMRSTSRPTWISSSLSTRDKWVKEHFLTCDELGRLTSRRGSHPRPGGQPMVPVLCPATAPVPPPSYQRALAKRPPALHIDALTLVTRLQLLALCRLAMQLSQRPCPPP